LTKNSNTKRPNSTWKRMHTTLKCNRQLWRRDCWSPAIPFSI